jgi:CheY-like chemotaxis protein
MDGHIVVNTINGQECVDVCQNDTDFDVVLMDLQ